LVKATMLGLTRADLEDAVLEGYDRRVRNVGAADWRLELGRLVILYNHPDARDATTARIVTVWRRR
jgi:hypothetical protein